MGTIILCSKNRKFKDCKVSFILEHWQEVNYLSIYESDQRFFNCCLRVYFRNGKIVEVYLPDILTAVEFVHRPEFYGIPLTWFGEAVEAPYPDPSTPPVIRTRLCRN